MTYDDDSDAAVPLADDAAPAPAEGYAIGYGKPPLASRFQKGRSGNPRGRPRGMRSFDIVLDDTLSQKTPMMVNGRRRYIDAYEAMALRVRKAALSGSPRELHKAIALAERIQPKAREKAPRQVADYDAMTTEQLRIMASIPLIDEPKKTKT